MVDFQSLTLASLLTAAGAAVAALLVTLLVDLWKLVLRSIPKLAGIDGVLLAGLFSLLLYLAVAASVGVPNLEAAFSIFVGWIACLAAAVGIHKAAIKPLARAMNGDT